MDTWTLRAVVPNLKVVLTVFYTTHPTLTVKAAHIG